MLKYLVNNKDAIDIMLRIGTLLVSALGFFWTVNNGLKTLSDNLKSKNNEQKVKWITFIDDGSQAKKLAGVFGLVKYTRDLYREIFCLCATEEKIYIKALLYENLVKESPYLINEFVDINVFYTRILAGQKALKDCENAGKLINQSHIVYIQKEYKQVKNQNESLHNFQFFNDTECSLDSILKYIVLSSHMIMHGQKKSSLPALTRLMLASTDFLSGSFIETVFCGCLLVDNVINHSQFINVKVIDCFISEKNSFYGSVFKDSEFCGTNMEKSKFRNSTFDHTVLSKLEYVTVCDFSCSNFNGSKIIKANISACFFKGCNVSGTSFEALTMKDCCNFIGAKFENDCKFKNMSFLKCDLSNCEITDCSFSMVKIFSSNLRNIVFSNTYFFRVNFSGSDMKNATFNNCEFVQCPQPKNTANADTVRAVNCKGTLFAVSR